jgi:hypothetical protein
MASEQCLQQLVVELCTLWPVGHVVAVATAHDTGSGDAGGVGSRAIFIQMPFEAAVCAAPFDPSTWKDRVPPCRGTWHGFFRCRCLDWSRYNSDQLLFG